jgi:hypothetical protein
MTKEYESEIISLMLLFIFFLIVNSAFNYRTNSPPVNLFNWVISLAVWQITSFPKTNCADALRPTNFNGTHFVTHSSQLLQHMQSSPHVNTNTSIG